MDKFHNTNKQKYKGSDCEKDGTSRPLEHRKLEDIYDQTLIKISREPKELWKIFGRQIASIFTNIVYSG